MRLSQFPDPQQFRQYARKHNVVPVCMEILADMETPVTLMQKIYGQGRPVFLFESMEGGERWGRYSFLGNSSRCEIRVMHDAVETIKDGRAERVAHHGQPLSRLRQVMADYTPATVPGLPRFWGGLVGYLTYEMVSFFEAIPNRMSPDTPLGHFMMPDELLVFDNLTNTLLLVVVSFTDDYASADDAYGDALRRLEELYRQMALPAVETPLPRPWANGHLVEKVDAEAFRRQVSRIKEYIVAGDIIQAVLSQPFTCDPPPDLISLYRAQRYINPSPYLFFLQLAQTALIGSSPETMVRLENGVATVRPIAGTRHRGSTEQEDRALADELLKDEKERAEHLMLVDLGRNDLGRVAETGTVQVTDLMVVERYSHVMHLVSNVCCDLHGDHDAWDLIRATFPTGTLSGAPKVRAMEIIAELEKTPRGPYGGAVGYVSFHGNMDLAITIRTACVQNGELTVRAGAGIVADSDPERERIETVNKAMAIQTALQLLQSSEHTDQRSPQ